NPDNPKTVFGYLTQSLKLRQRRDSNGCTIQSCDNVQENGNMTKKMLCSYIGKAEPDLLKWVEENVSFPNSMVDRITPVTVESDMAILQEKYQIDDQWPVVCESFIQWVIEDDFIAGRPQWELAGAQFVKNVAPYENMKLSLLNAGHSVLGILGALHGYDTIDEAASDLEFQSFLRSFMDNEVTPILKDLDDIDLEQYKDNLIARFKNIHIKDQISRICLESSVKFPKFLLPTLRAQLKENGSIAQVTFVIAAWCKYNKGIDENGRSYEINDAISDVLKEAALQSHKDPISFLKIESVFGDLVQSKRFIDTYIDALNCLSDNKIRACVKEFNS
ncbi:MAG: mannitol dehydrogenase family protein, partial [Bacteroidales bacterium]|nr:mannitol dehydrogenase family protein [Bacteroidales bacterium]